MSDDAAFVAWMIRAYRCANIAHRFSQACQNGLWQNKTVAVDRASFYFSRSLIKQVRVIARLRIGFGLT